MNYEQALAYLNSAEFLDTRPGLCTITQLLHILGDPQQGLPFLHIVGTDWKWVTGATIESLLLHAGVRPGLFTSHYFRSVNDRIRFCDEDIPDADLARLTGTVRDAVEQMRSAGGPVPTIYELFVAVALLYFREKQPDLIIMEASLGGKHDATNVIPDPEATVITHISSFHMSHLGNTLGEIAAQKAGVIRPGVPVFSWMQEKEAKDVIRETCRKQNAPLAFVRPDEVTLLGSTMEGQRIRLGDDPVMTIPFFGDYQAYNAALAVKTVRYLAKRHDRDLTTKEIAAGLRGAHLEGQLTVISRDPLVIIDNAKNEELVEVLYQSLDSMYPAKQITFIAGFMGTNFTDRTMMNMFRELGPLTRRVLAVTPEGRNVVPAAHVVELLRENGYDAEAFDSAEAVARKCRTAYRNDIICGFGSFSVIRSLEKAFGA